MPLSQEVLNNLQELADSIEENTPKVAQQITDQAVAASASKYHAALKRLAEE